MKRIQYMFAASLLLFVSLLSARSAQAQVLPELPNALEADPSSAPFGASLFGQVSLRSPALGVASLRITPSRVSLSAESGLAHQEERFLLQRAEERRVRLRRRRALIIGLSVFAAVLFTGVALTFALREPEPSPPATDRDYCFLSPYCGS